jgi:hypothetical protein
MGDSNQVLSQEDIDALVGKAVSKKSAPPSNTLVAADDMPQTKPRTIASIQSDTPVQPSSSVIKAVAPGSKIPKISSAHSSSHEECIAAGEIASLGNQISRLSVRLAKIEESITKMETKVTNNNQISPAQFKAAMQQIQNVSSQVEIITDGLRGTAGYNLNKTFKCNSCGSLGVVAVKVKCTKCGLENWWGWWPKKK